jgi:hypothetical protein
MRGLAEAKVDVLSPEYRAKRQHKRKLIDTTGNVAKFRYLKITVTEQNSFHEGIKSKLNSGNVCYHSVQNRLSSRLLSTNVKIRIYKTIMLPVVLYGCETWAMI